MLRLHVRVQLSALIYTMHEAVRGYAHEGGGATSQLDLLSLTPLPVAGCGWLQLGVPHWAASSRSLVDFHMERAGMPLHDVVVVS